MLLLQDTRTYKHLPCLHRQIFQATDHSMGGVDKDDDDRDQVQDNSFDTVSSGADIFSVGFV